MMTLFALLATIATIIGIARYNESDKLFWKLLIAFIGSYAAASLVINLTNDKKEDKVVMIKNAPMQVLGSVPSLKEILAGISYSAASGTKSPKPAGKDYVLNYNNSILSEVHAHSRGQPDWNGLFDTS